MKTAYGNVCSLSCQCIDLIGKVFEENFETAFPGAVSWSIIDIPRGRRVARKRLHSSG